MRTRAPSIVFVGGGPRTTGILLRIAANLPAGVGPRRIDIVDPYPPGGGRIWRRAQSPMLWMNSMARDVTIFADDSVEMDGPTDPGPSLDEWANGVGRATLEAAGLGHELARFSARSFPSRRLQSEYLSWAFDEALRRLESVDVRVHRGTAVELLDGSPQKVLLDSGAQIEGDVVVLAQGHLDTFRTPESAKFSSAAESHGLTYIPPGFTADQDLSQVRAGRPAIVRGFGLAFIDAMVLLTEGRGGRFRGAGETTEYVPSGEEPILWVGSRRGVPYRPKLGYDVTVTDPHPRFLDDESLSKINDGVLDFARDVSPLIEWNLRFSHYAQLFSAHPGRTNSTWGEVSIQLHRLLPPALGGDPGKAATRDVENFLHRAVPELDDHFDLAALDRPLSGFEGARQDLEQDISALISASIHRSANPDFSMDLAVFLTLLHTYFRIHELAAEGRFSLADRRENIDRKLHGFFSYMASGPPPVRLHQLLALHRAGIVRFIGPNMTVDVHDDHFSARSSAIKGAGNELRTETLIDAFLADNSAACVRDKLLQRLRELGEITIEPGTGSTGKFLTDGCGHPLGIDGTAHPFRFLLGPMVSGSGGEAPFSRPGTNARGFRRADAVARQLLDTDVAAWNMIA